MAHVWSKSKVVRFQEKPPIAPACTQYNPKLPHPGGLNVVPFGKGASDRFCLVSWSSPAGNLQENDTSNKTSCIVGSASCKGKRPVWGEKQQNELKEKLQTLNFKKDEVIRRRKRHMQRNRQMALMKKQETLDATKQENSEQQQRAAAVQDIIPISQRGNIEVPAAWEQFVPEKGLPLQMSDTAAVQESYKTRMLNQLSQVHSEKMELASKLDEKCVEIRDLRSKFSNLEDKLSCMADLRMEVQQLWCKIEEERMGKETAELLVTKLKTEISGLHKQINPRAVTLSENLAQVMKSKEEAEELLKVLEDSSRLFSEALEERSSELESLKAHVEAELEVRKTSESRLSQLQSELELMRYERDEAQRARDITMVQNREYVEKMTNRQGQYATALANVESTTSEKEEIQRALGAATMQNREYVEKMTNLQSQYETALANVNSSVREREEMQRALDAVIMQSREYVEKITNLQSQYETALANVDSTTREKVEMQRALDAVTMQSREHVEKITSLQSQYETALANVDSTTREKVEMQRALDAVTMQSREYVEKMTNLQSQYETALANVDSTTREKVEIQRALDESLAQDRKQVEKFDDVQQQYAATLADMDSLKCTQAYRDTELVNIRKKHSEEVSGITHELEEQCKEINQLRASLGISAGLLGSTCRQVTSLQNELCCQKALKDKADLEARQLANRLGELQQEIGIPKQQLQVRVASTSIVSKATNIRDRIKKENMELKKQAAEAQKRPVNFISDFCTSQLNQTPVMEMSGASSAAAQWKVENITTPPII